MVFSSCVELISFEAWVLLLEKGFITAHSKGGGCSRASKMRPLDFQTARGPWSEDGAWSLELQGNIGRKLCARWGWDWAVDPQ